MSGCKAVRFRALMIGLFVLPIAGCGGRASIAPPSIPSDAPQKALVLYDLDKNGWLDAAELEKAPGIKAAFPGSNKVTAEDIAARIAQWKKAGFGRMSFMLHVKHNDRPLPDATVTLVPESIMGGGYPRATGKTNQNGATMPTVPINSPEDGPGAPPGFYRMEVTKEGENIPAKYNAKTVLGVEVFMENEGQGSVYDLKY
jgi:hypothetical protein